MYVRLSRPCYGELAFVHILCYRRAGRRISIIFEPYGSDKVGVATDEHVIAYSTAMLIIAVIVYTYGSASEVYPLSYIGISYIAQMRQFCSCPDV